MKFLQYQVDSFGLSDVGLTRPNNEDVFRIMNEKKFYILADGMGGHKAGEIASSTAVETVCTSIQALPEQATLEKTCHHLRKSIAAANSAVYSLAKKNKAYTGMGTTLSCFTLREDTLIYGHVGDSRLYRKRHRLEQLTEDHSLRHVTLTHSDQANSSPPSLLCRHVITRAIGTHSYVIPDVGVISIQPNDLYMLCSDGLSDAVPLEIISEILDPALPLEEITLKLLNCALEKGGNDNITILLVKITP